MRDLSSYFDDVLDILVAAPSFLGFAEEPKVEERDNQFGSLSFAVRYSDGSELHVHLWADCSQDQLVWTDYSFHYQAADAALRFRYDDTRDHPELANYPHHLHVGPAGRGERLYPFGPPGVRSVAQIVEWHLNNPGERWEPSAPLE